MERLPQQDVEPAEAVILVIASFLFFILTSLVLGFFWSSKAVLLVIELLVVVPVVIYVLFRRLAFAQTFRFHALSLRQWLYTIIVALSGFVLMDELDRLIMLIFPMPRILVEAIESTMQIHSLSDGIFLVLSAVVVAGLGEEMLFRGFLQRTLEKHLDPPRGIVLTAIAFALLHLNPWSALQITAIGLLLGYLVWKSQSLWPAVFVHTLNNLLSVWFINSKESAAWYSGETHVQVIWIFLALLCFVPALLAFNRECEKSIGGN